MVPGIIPLADRKCRNCQSIICIVVGCTFSMTINQMSFSDWIKVIPVVEASDVCTSIRGVFVVTALLLSFNSFGYFYINLFMISLLPLIVSGIYSSLSFG